MDDVNHVTARFWKALAGAGAFLVFIVVPDTGAGHTKFKTAPSATGGRSRFSCSIRFRCFEFKIGKSTPGHWPPWFRMFNDHRETRG